ncbi:MAG: FAD-dependent oxidoreductase [Prosthecobacter sp.]|uniref:FAD-dependent oxidoreductase n=1 Tax=Prosthecobacter sp. TaxID=1965333 RepID=UPI003900949C
MKHDVIIIGAGPVGLLLALLLGQRGLNVLVLEQRTELPQQSQAIGITPPSLEILATVGLAQSFVQSGVCIRDCFVHGHTGRLGGVSFRDIAGAHRFILSLPQRQTMRLLEEALMQQPTVKLMRGIECAALSSQADGVIVRTAEAEFHAAFVVACDGAHSRVRELLGIRTRRREYGCQFVMGDFIDRTAMQDDAHLFFTAAGAVESFPLPEGQRRWIVQTNDETDLVPQVRQRTGMLLNAADQLNASAFSPWRLDCERLHLGHVLLCGDAAHVMSPIGGQGMNTGFADAEFAAAMLHAILRHGENAERWFKQYEHCRQTAARTAARRAEWGMGLGVWRGVMRSLLRDFIIRSILRSDHVPPWFAMQSLPFNRYQP